MGMKINTELPLPAYLKAKYPLPEELVKLKAERGEEIRSIFEGKSDKFVVIVGPCSADREDSVCEYVDRLAKVNEKVTEFPGSPEAPLPGELAAKQTERLYEGQH